MNIIRFLLWCVVLLLVWRLLRRNFLHKRHIPQSVRMVRCAYCDIHLPEKDAVYKNELWYCNRQHLEADQNPES